MSGQAGILFGWRPAEFWAATPAELAALVEAFVGEGDGVSGEDVEVLRRMLLDDPSTMLRMVPLPVPGRI